VGSAGDSEGGQDTAVEFFPAAEHPGQSMETRLLELRERYREERDKRLGADRGENLDLTQGQLSRYLDDPHVPPSMREPVHRTADVVVVGGGFAGLVCAAKMRERGFARICLIDKAGDVGGVWYWNRYPGAMCDTESYIYLPLLDEIDYVPERKYSFAPEILSHAQRIAKRYDLYSDALFQTSVTDVAWDEARKRWIIRTDRDDEITAQFVILALGSLNYPKLPNLPGIEQFAGHSFHCSRWDYDYTGGDNTGNLAKLRHKVVGIVGTAASAVQAIPHLGRAAKHLYVFQRTPSVIGIRANRPTDPGWAARLMPGWQAERKLNFASIMSGVDVPVDLVNDGWTALFKRLRNPRFSALALKDVALAVEMEDDRLMDAIRARVDSIVEDKAAASALKPYYRYLCKRPTFHDEYLATFNRPNVTLVDTRGKGLDAVCERGVVANGRPYDLDCLIFATGFEVFGAAYSARFAGFQVCGRGGINLEDKWSAGIATLHGLTSAGFPNLFFIPTSNAQSAVVSNLMYMIVENASHVAHIAAAVRDAGAETFEVEQEAEDIWVKTILDRRVDNSAYLANCTPGRFNNEGRLGEMKPMNSNFDPGALALVGLLREWREAGMPGLALA
jgi:cation diffusion facilitator CzcD-associated flavoprotein CzcO